MKMTTSVLPPLLLALMALATSLPAQETTIKKGEAEILGLASWTRERFTEAVKEHCKGRW